MVREDLISSAVRLLQDPSVTNSPLDKRIAFLRSKNLTQEEIDAALARAGDSSSPPPPPPPPPQSYGYPTQQMTRQPNGYGYGYGPYPNGPWSQPLEPPRRDWRDYFIIATLTSTLGYTLYTLSRRYITPLISPPTPPQLEADKASIDASFARAFALIDQLATDTSAIKTREEERTEKLDKALAQVNAVVEELKDAHKRRERESAMLADQVHGLRELVPKALEGWKEKGDGRLEELGADVRSLKKLLGARLGGTTGPMSSSSNLNATTPSLSPKHSSSQLRTSSNPSPPSGFGVEMERSLERRGSGTALDAVGLGGKVAAGKASYEGTEMGERMAPAPGVNVPKREGSGPQGFGRSGKAAIPAWQMAAGVGKGEGSSGDSGTS
ncbi:MAG: hypothetical protein LQ344_002244 [Seirophora lacunosa]|nr:MAG: hypothetical protein LQ344_002244 [Seirophora lacunosa]